LESLVVKKGCWNVSKVGIFQGENQIGEYTRNYESFIESTFFPFCQDDKWYALYSPEYTVTRLMTLPDCKDIGGEVDETGQGFCPVDFYVPEITIQKILYPSPIIDNKWRIAEPFKNGVSYKWPDNSNLEWMEYKNKHNADFEKWLSDHPFTTEYAKFGFVSGCRWGDDTSWKIRFLDLSKVKDGIVVADDRLGYVELPPKVKLMDAIDVTQETDQESPIVSIAVATNFSIDVKPVKL